MLERETELIKQIIVESTIDGRDAVKLSEVVAAELPRGVKAFMTAQVISLLEADLEKSSQLQHITKGIASTVMGDRTLLRSLAMAFSLPREEFVRLTEDTVHFLENYLCRPQWTLKNVMFEKSQTITFEEMAKKLEFAVEYSYFRILIDRHALRNGWKTITAEEFASLVEKVDQEVVRKHSPRELALLTKPIYDFLLFGDPSMDLPIPLGAILLFFDDKKMTTERDHIERIYKVRSRTQISMNELIGILEDLYRVESTVKEEVEETEKEILAPITSPMESSPSQHIVDEQPTEQPEPIAAEKQEEKHIEEHGENREEEHIIAPARVDILSTTKDGVEKTPLPPNMPHAVDAIFFDATQEETAIDVTNLHTEELAKDLRPAEMNAPTVVNPNVLAEFAKERQRLRDAILSFPDHPGKDVQKAENLDVDDSFPVERRAKFIRRIFKGNEKDYAIFISSINKAQSWREAQVHLRQLFEINKLDVLSPEVVEFTDAMHARFTPDLKKA
jgi:hypothetical protein